MPDDRISDSPKPTGCPVCATGFADTPGANCPACGRVFAPPGPMSDSDFRRLPLDPRSSRLQGPVMVGIGILLLVGTAIACIAFDAAGLLVLLAIPLALALPRAIRLATLPQPPDTKTRSYYLLWSLLASVSVTVLAGVAASVAAGAICALSAAVRDLGAAILCLLAGNAVGVCVFFFLYYKLWPRESEYQKSRNPPDPED